MLGDNTLRVQPKRYFFVGPGNYRNYIAMAFVPAQMLPQSRPLNRSLNRYTPTCATTTPAFPKKFTRRAVLTALAAAAGSLLAVDASNSESPSEKLQYRVVKSGSGPAAEVGDLVGIRFKGAYNGVVFDNLFENKTPYFYRVGSGAILKVSNHSSFRGFPLEERLTAHKPRMCTYALVLR